MTPPDTFPAGPARFDFPGPAGILEVATAVPEPADARAGSAIVCHPHPLHGGTMDNKVVTTTERALRELGLRTLRFNFRGVGRSAGEHDKGVGETHDLITLAEWLESLHPGEALWLAGFSFGSYVAAKAVRHLKVAQLISIAPPMERYPFDALPANGVPWLIVHGTEDDVAAIGAVRDYVARSAEAPQLVEIEGAEHFFHGRLLDLRGALKNGVRANLPPSRAA